MITYHLVTFRSSFLLSSQCCCLTAFLHLLLLTVSSADPLPAPTISTDPSYDVYYEGERFAVVCNAPKERKIGGFQFFNQSGQKINQRAPHAFPTAWLQLTAAEASAGEYTCMYFVEELGQEVPSKRSLPLSVKVQAAPVAPSLSLDPQQQVYRSGNCVKLLCSIPPSPHYVREIQYYADFGFAVSIPVWNVKNYSYDLGITGEELSGSYSCAYFVIESRRPVRSARSQWTYVKVKSYKFSWIREIVVGGSFFTINGLIFFFSHRLMKRREDQD
ncbi:uncharacterized protein LOC142359955 isoform X2 [Opisthocomus hoazin]|uniref:uncharacterized protein LOC142359955 isoform X2 n=1 Tax=Opisthocomus hoazin TaxID=30419 RepID=UPI003F535270